MKSSLIVNSLIFDYGFASMVTFFIIMSKKAKKVPQAAK